jgi:Mg2+/Co2+ transporter CorB
MTTSDVPALIIIVVCLLLSSFFAGSETALTASSRARMLWLACSARCCSATMP